MEGEGRKKTIEGECRLAKEGEGRKKTIEGNRRGDADWRRREKGERRQ
jgi:hypothetical protein